VKNLALYRKRGGPVFVCALCILVSSFASFFQADVFAEIAQNLSNSITQHNYEGKLSNKTKGPEVEERSRRDIEGLILKWTNEERKKRAIPALMISGLLGKLAQQHSRNQAGAGLMAHNSEKFPKGWQTFGERMKKLHFSGSAAYGENVFWTSAKLPLISSSRNDYSRKVVQAWMSSPGHRRNILNPKFTRMGGGFYDGYVTQLFASQDPKI